MVCFGPIGGSGDSYQIDSFIGKKYGSYGEKTKDMQKDGTEFKTYNTDGSVKATAHQVNHYDGSKEFRYYDANNGVSYSNSYTDGDKLRIANSNGKFTTISTGTGYAIDRNNNGVVDYNEVVHSDGTEVEKPSLLQRGINYIRNLLK